MVVVLAEAGEEPQGFAENEDKKGPGFGCVLGGNTHGTETLAGAAILVQGDRDSRKNRRLLAMCAGCCPSLFTSSGYTRDIGRQVLRGATLEATDVAGWCICGRTEAANRVLASGRKTGVATLRVSKPGPRAPPRSRGAPAHCRRDSENGTTLRGVGGRAVVGAASVCFRHVACRKK